MSTIDQIKDTYEVIEELGQGSGGTVFRAYHKRLEKEVVLKRMHNNQYSRLYQRKEVDILKKLNHSYLPQVLDFLQLENEVYTVMSFVPGHSFQQLLDQHQRFSQKQITGWAIQLCGALEYLHSQNPPIIHSDIKPANIMLTPQQDICLIDFNISFFMDDRAVLGYTGGYSSPEQYIVAMSQQSSGAAAQDVHIDEKSDIYSLGATLYRLATGQKINDFEKGIDAALLTRNTSEAFAQVIQKATQVDPAKRFASAGQMRQAFMEISQKDQRYRRLLVRQKGEVVIWAAALFSFCLMTVWGVNKMGDEKQQRYDRFVEVQREEIKNGDHEKQLDAYEEAKKINPEELESHFQNAMSFYQQRDYRACVDFIDRVILNDQSIRTKGSRMADVYYLKGESLFQLQDYDESVGAFKESISIGEDNLSYYRDYAVALAYNGDPQEAKRIMDQASEKGLKEDSAYYIKGEIEYSLMNISGAIQEFSQCIDESQDDYMKMRAYVMKSKLLEEQGQLKEARAVLQEARQQLAMQEQLNILERLVAVDLKLLNSDDPTCLAEAITVSKEIIEQNWATYTTYNNLAILYQHQQESGKALEILDQMKQRFGEDYNLFKRYAFLEAQNQEQLDNNMRDYKQFETYYRKAVELYQNNMENNASDSEMKLLEDAYDQVVKGGWLS